MIPRESIPAIITLAASPFIGAEAALGILAASSCLAARRPELCPWLWVRGEEDDVPAPPPPFLAPPVGRYPMPLHASSFHEWGNTFSYYPSCHLVSLLPGERRDNDDGDSVRALTDGREEVIFRVIGVDTPETNRQLKERRFQQMLTHQCDEVTLDRYAREAKELAHEALRRGFVVYTNNMPVYGGERLWAVLWFRHGDQWCELGELMVAHGLARVMENHRGCPPERMARLLRHQHRAQVEGRKLWAGHEKAASR